MFQKMNKQISPKIVSLTFSVLVVCFAMAFYAYALDWTGPTQDPPGGNVSAPINAASSTQYKSGALGVEGVLRGYSNLIVDGSIGIGTTAPGAKLDVNGDI
ncbi:MAG: hypothetical protein COT67_00195, partial [Candidatus Tagabacteria bacterium CG09_land_8_20_14_0_10_41_14]